MAQNRDVSLTKDMAYCRVGSRPRGDDGYFEQMSKVIFRSGLNHEVIEKKWPGFREAFSGFDPGRVARFGPRDIERLMEDTSIVRNRRKIEATIENAREFLAVQKEHGSFHRFIRQTGRGGEEALVRAVRDRFAFLGGHTAVFFLRAVGEEMPETVAKMRK
ncbi:MAG: DNA-3-methyladenine glycosylase I [Euryarchaeota archaeon]|nr:DNA-3-methyladenine glycosylase I [Euryarchaeota archaeon]